MDRNDDDSAGPVDLGFSINFFGQNYSELFVNNNGNVTFGVPLANPDPSELSTLQIPMLATFWADVDTRNQASGVVTYGVDTIDGSSAFGVNWNDVGYFESKADKTNDFQMVVIDRSDLQPGAFDLEFNYGRVQWEIAETPGGPEFDTARAGFVQPRGRSGSSYELIGSGVPGAFLDGDSPSALIAGSLGSSEPGRYVFEFRDGTALNELGLVGQAIDVGNGITYLGSGFPREMLLNEEIDNAADTINADQLYLGGGAGVNLTGAGLTVGHWDSGLPRLSHQEFGGRVASGDGTTDETNHGTAVAGVIASTGGFNAGISRGIANRVNVMSNDWDNDIPAELMAQAAQIVASNHSYGQTSGWDDRDFGGAVGDREAWMEDRALFVEDTAFGKYNSTASQLDNVLFQNPGLVSVWAAGNDRNDAYADDAGDAQYAAMFSAAPGGATNLGSGWYLVPNSGGTTAPGPDGGAVGYDSLPPQKTAKNSLVVGSVGDVLTDPVGSVTLSAFSSFGPTDDGRIKPDLVANGEGLTVPDFGADDAYRSGVSGTSVAAPAVTGTVALLHQHFLNLNGGATPRAATMKGLLIHTALDMETVGPDYRSGWGLTDAAAAAEFLSREAVPVPGEVHDFREATLGDGVTDTYFVDVSSGKPLHATLVWTDPAGAAQGDGLDDATSVLVNDLDLEIVGPDGVHLPWTLDPANPADPAVRNARNSRDNVEQVVIDDPEPGTYMIRVSHMGSLGEFESQDYSLLFSGRQVEPDKFEPNDTLETATDVGSKTEVTLRGLTIHNSDDVDYFKYTAHSTGKLIVNARFLHECGDLNLEIRDRHDNVLQLAASSTDDEQIVIPVVSQEMYFVRVFDVDHDVNEYSLELENFPAPVPSGVHLDPASDTGMDPMDLKTADNTPRIFVQADLTDFEAMGIALLESGDITAPIPAGAAVQVVLTNSATGIDVTGFADRIDSSTTLWEFTPTVALDDGVYFLSATTWIWDLQQDDVGAPAPLPRAHSCPHPYG